MTTVLQIAGVVLVVLLIALAVFVTTRPNVFRVQRSATLPAPASAVFPLIDNFRNWTRWSPWEKLDSQLVRAYEGPAAGRGSVYAWKGNKKVGEGRMTIVDSVPNERIKIDLEFIKPFASRNDTIFTLTPAAGGTRVDWLMEGPNSLMGKIMSLFMDMDAMVGKSFEQGLADLGAAAQIDANAHTAGPVTNASKPEAATIAE